MKSSGLSEWSVFLANGLLTKDISRETYEVGYLSACLYLNHLCVLKKTLNCVIIS